MSDLLDSDGPDYDPDLYASLIDHMRKAERESGGPVLIAAPPARTFNYRDRVRVAPADNDRLVDLVARGLVPGDEGIVEMALVGDVALVRLGIPSEPDDRLAFVRAEDLDLVRASTDLERRTDRTILDLP